MIEYISEVIYILIIIHSDKKAVKQFLEELKEIIENSNFDIVNNLLLIKKKKNTGKEEYSTPYTMTDLDYDTYDIVECLKKLKVAEYSETLIDKDDDRPPLLFVFGQNINSKQVYIKLKIKGDQTKRVLCLSFHYAEYKMTFPYA